MVLNFLEMQIITTIKTFFEKLKALKDKGLGKEIIRLFTKSEHRWAYMMIVALYVIVLVLIIWLIINSIRLSVNKHRVVKATVKQVKSSQKATDALDLKYSSKKHCVALIHLEGLDRYDRAYDRQVTKSIHESVAKYLEKNVKGDTFARTSNNEYVVIFNKCDDVEAYLKTLSVGISSLKINGEALDITPYISYNNGDSDTLAVELNRNAIALNKALRDGVDIVGVDQALIDENVDYLRLVKEIESLIDEDKLEACYKLVADVSNSKIKYVYVGAKAGLTTTFDGTLKNAIFRENLNNKLNLALATKVAANLGKNYDVKFIFNVNPSLTEEEISHLNEVCADIKSQIVLGFESEDYVKDTKAFLKLKSLISENGYLTALLNAKEVFDMNSLKRFDFVSLTEAAYTDLDGDLENIYKTGNADKSLNGPSVEALRHLTENEIYPLVESNELFTLFGEAELETILVINSLSKNTEKVVYVKSEPVEEAVALEAPVEEATEDAVLEVLEEDEADDLEVEEALEDAEDEDEDDSESETETESAEDNAFGGFRKIKSKPFCIKMDNASDETKFYYNTLKNELAKYEKFRNQVSKSADGFKYKNKACAKIRMAGKSIRLYLDLNPLAYPITRFHHVDVSDKKKYTRTPFMVKVKSNMGLKKAIILIDEMAKIYDVERNELYENRDYLIDIHVQANEYRLAHKDEEN